ncbi:phenylalanyl-tRNA synthetase, beta subunit [Candidatus Blochmanniella vafra str. BVAF]|uniref:Phenylalanine--tRNA ligase beta subunit n=1 Tax=Blochmanniella vafra (strain BVAF) TaxID=859654 RepID=E8Q659_BLOVB|nr:phenylalanine--tRNA ligase subunit beta [Candidatus Blochmannia vafer]ADV33753.1 phenylalanyl-tRNA synthetase, beta subunit [Candidatus Blochmannia vafer str. BVAF]
MKYSELWLRKWTNPPVTHNELINQLTMAGFNVNETQSIILNKFYGVVIAEIINFKIHPNVDNTWIITINNGTNKLISIISDNHINYRKKMKVVVANIGALLPDGQVVTSKIIQGIKSEGILCTFSTLGLHNNRKDIIELPDNAPIGYDFYDYLDLNDKIIDVDITPNRGDCLSIIGLAREIASINKLQLKKLIINTIIPTTHETIPIRIEEPKFCPKFLGKIIKNININVPTPLKIQEKLRRCGIRSTNIVEDITNYVVLELGHPIHIYDYEKINKNEIIIRLSKPGEKLIFDEKNINIKLFENTLIISDRNKPLAIAGLEIENKSNISLKTSNIFIQVSFLDPTVIIKQSKLYNFHHFYTMQYERGVDCNISELTLNYFTELLIKNCNGHVGPTIKIINKKFIPKIKKIKLQRAKLNSILGFHVETQDISNILKSLGFKINVKDNLWIVSIPTWRFDINIEENLISEIIRIYGYNKIPQDSIKTVLIPNSLHTQLSNETVTLSKSKIILIDRGYQEIITYSFINPNIQKLMKFQDITPFTLINPINQEMSVMRLSLWPGLIKTMLYNQNRQQKDIRLFESGMCFIPNKNNNDQVSHQFMLSGIRSEFKNNEHWDSKISSIDFYDIKGDVESVLNMIYRHNQIIFKSCIHPALHPGQRAEIYCNNILIGYIGMIHPKIQHLLGLRANILMFELFWDAIPKFTLSQITSVSKFPKNHRDISFVLPIYISASAVIDELKKLNINQLICIKLIDLYTGKKIPIGFKSFTIKLTFQSNTHTFQEQEIKEILNTCIITLQKRFHIILR